MGAVKFSPITEEQYDYFLNVLPPIEFCSRCFLVGEPVRDTLCRITGKVLPSYHACFDFGRGQYFEASEPLTRPEFKAITKTGAFVRIEPAPGVKVALA